MHPLLLKSRPILGHCLECSAGFTERVDWCSVCGADLEWCNSCGKQISDDNERVTSSFEDACQSCTENPCIRCGAPESTDPETRAFDDSRGIPSDGVVGRICGMCIIDDLCKRDD